MPTDTTGSPKKTVKAPTTAATSGGGNSVDEGSAGDGRVATTADPAKVSGAAAAAAAALGLNGAGTGTDAAATDESESDDAGLGM